MKNHQHQNTKTLGLITFFLAFISVVVSAQPNQEKLYKKGMNAYYSENFTEAITYFEQIKSNGEGYKDSDYRLEISYLVSSNTGERNLDKIIRYSEDKSKNDAFYHYWMGRIYSNRYMYREAIDAFNEFLSRKSYKTNEIIAETKWLIEQSQYLMNQISSSGDYEVHQLQQPVNSQFSEFSPVYFDNSNGILFASNRNESLKKEYKIYESKNSEAGWEAPEALDVLGTFTEESANIEVVNEDGKLFMFRDIEKGDLFYSELKNSAWTAPKEFDSKITSADIGSHFYINEHEDRIIFSSPNNKNGLDLMESFKDAQTGEWRKPEYLTNKINSEYDDDSPFLSVDETRLYFSSFRPGGLGGFDIYECVLDKEKNTWSEPRNLGWPINSPGDELFFKLNEDGNSGHFSSNRLGSVGGFDIYSFWESQEVKVRGKVLNAKNTTPIGGGEIKFHPTTYREESFKTSIDKNGNYELSIIANETFRVEIIDGIDTLLIQTFTAEETEGESVTHLKDFYIADKSLSIADKEVFEEKNVSVEQRAKSSENSTSNSSSLSKTKSNGTSLDNRKSVYNPASTPLKNIYFEYGTSTLTKESEKSLKSLLENLQSKSNVTIEISGHTDNVGSKFVNQILSENRAKSVKNWLVKEGIASSKIKAAGYGEKYPLASNDDELNGRELNRRIEIRIAE